MIVHFYMKVVEIIQRVESLMAKGISVSIEGGYISRRWIYNLMVGFRAKIIGQEVNKKQKISDWNKQMLTCVELVDATLSECECISKDVCSYMKRTKNRIPEIMSGLSDYAIDSITNSTGGLKIDLVKYNQSKYNRYSKYSSKKMSAFIYDGYVFLENAKHLQAINILALFEDPLEVEKFNAENDICNKDSVCADCISPLDIEFPIDNDKIDTLVMLVINEISMAFLNRNQQQKQEEENDRE